MIGVVRVEGCFLFLPKKPKYAIISIVILANRMTTNDKKRQQEIRQLYQDYQNFLVQLTKLQKEAQKLLDDYAKKIQEAKLQKIRKKI